MAAAFSMDLRTRIVTAAKTMRASVVAQLFQVSRVTVSKYLRLDREGKDLSPKKGYQRGHSHKLELEVLRTFIEASPTSTLKETGHTLGLSIKTVHKGLKKLGITKKKISSIHGAQ